MKLTGILFLLLISFSFPLEVKDIYYRKVHPMDKGTVYIFLYNNSRKPEKIKEVYYNGEKLKDIPNDYTLWYQLTPPEILPGSYGELKIKLRWETKKLIKVEFKDIEGKRYETMIEPKTSLLNFSGAYFDKELKTLYIYIQNISDRIHTLKKLYFDGKDITRDCFIPEKEINSGEKIVVIYEMSEPVKSGKYIYLKAETEGEKISTLIRAYSHFVLEGYGGDTRKEINFNPDRFDFHYNEKKLSTFSDLPEYKACHIFDDPACRDGIKRQLLGTSAKEIIKRIEKFYQYDKKHPTFLYGCEHRKPDNYFIYSELVDVFVVDPYEITYYHNPPEKNAHYTKLAKLACQPKILWTIPEAFTHRGTRFQTPEEERIIVWSEIGEGSKGIWYYVYNQKIGYPANNQLEEEIKKINWELQKLKDYILISEPFKLAKVDKEKITPYTLLCGDKGIILILINNDHKSYFEKPPYFQYKPKENIKVEIKIPFWLKVKKIKEIRYPEIKEEKNYRMKENKLTLLIKKLQITKQYIIETERK